MTVMNIRTADLFLECQVNPTGDNELATVAPADLREGCGMIPDFFCQAAMENVNDLTLDAIADAMDWIYQFGGFCYPFTGEITEAGIYQSSFDEDPDLPPLARYRAMDRFECFVYQYGITALRDRETGQTKVARFD